MEFKLQLALHIRTFKSKLKLELHTQRATSRSVRKVIAYLRASTGGTLCSHSVRTGPLNRYAERGSGIMLTRSHFPFVSARLRRKTHLFSSEMPTTLSNTALSRCHPIPAPGAYSLTRACSKASGSSSANMAAVCRRVSSHWESHLLSGAFLHCNHSANRRRPLDVFPGSRETQTP